MSSLFSIGEDEMDLDDEVSWRNLRSIPCTFVLTIDINLKSFTPTKIYRTKGKSSLSLEKFEALVYLISSSLKTYTNWKLYM